MYNYISSPQDLNGDGNDDTYVRYNTKDIKQYGLKSEYRNEYKKLVYMLGMDIGRRVYDSYREYTSTYSTYSYWTKSYTTYYKGESSLDESTDDRLGIYAETKYKITDKLTGVLNVRYDHNKYTDDSLDHDYNGTVWSDISSTQSTSFDNVTYRIGATYDITKKQVLYANISTSFRNPSLSQLEDNPNLDKEKYITYEVGSRGSLSYGLRYEASAFITDTKDIISKVDGTYNWDSDYYANVGDARNGGLELSLKSDRRKKGFF